MFIILHEKSGDELIINIKYIESVYKSFVCFQNNSYQVQESYDEIKEAIKKAMWSDIE